MWGRKCSLFPEHMTSLPVGSAFVIYTLCITELVSCMTMLNDSGLFAWISLAALSRIYFIHITCYINPINIKRIWWRKEIRWIYHCICYRIFMNNGYPWPDFEPVTIVYMSLHNSGVVCQLDGQIEAFSIICLFLCNHICYFRGRLNILCNFFRKYNNNQSPD